jgi:Uri superfamily endonuclease
MVHSEASSTIRLAKSNDGLWSPTEFKTRPGTYALLLSSASNGVIQLGRLGDLQLQPGFYVYVGSALGPGGVRARLSHHIRHAEHPHWHIDYLRFHTMLEEIWFCYEPKSREHDWARCFAGMRGASVPMVGFGSSDCGCETHLSFFKKLPAKEKSIHVLSHGF